MLPVISAINMRYLFVYQQQWLGVPVLNEIGDLMNYIIGIWKTMEKSLPDDPNAKKSVNKGIKYQYFPLCRYYKIFSFNIVIL